MNNSYYTSWKTILSVMVLLGALLSGMTSKAALAITTKQLPPDTNTIPYSQVINVSGGLPPYAWKMLAGSFPDGLTLNATNGTLSGTSHAAAWEYQYPFTAYVSVTDHTGASTGASFPVPLVAPSAGGASSQSQYLLTVVNGSGGGNFAAGTSVAITAANAPAGQVFSGWTGATVANSLAASTTLVMPAAATMVTANYQAPAIPAAPLALTAATLPPAMVGSAYSQSLHASGGHPPYKWNLQSGNLPSGLMLDPNLGIISGVATAPGAYVYASPTLAYVTILDSVGASAGMTYQISVIPSTNLTYNLTVNGGMINGGAGSQALVANSTVTITAVPPNSYSTFTGWAGAAVANPASPSTTLVMPAAPTVVTASFINNAPSFQLTVTGGTGGGVYPAGTQVNILANTAPAGEVFQAWTGGTVANQFAANTTLVMPSNSVSLTAVFGATANPPATIPQPVTSHPRLWVTTNDLPRLQSWACATNPVYAQGVQVVLGKAINDYNTLFFPGGVANTNWPDPGDNNAYGGVITENYIYIFGLNALIDPNPANRSLYAKCARNLIMHVMNLAAQGFLTNAPFRDPNMCIGNRDNFFLEAYPLVVDWIYHATDTNGAPVLSAADKATIRQVFLMWAGEQVSPLFTGGNPEPSGAMNNHVLLPGGNAFRFAANNYYSGHARLVTMMSLAFDPADDPAVNPSLPVSILGNSLRSYIADATGAWLYQQYAMYGDPTNVCADYNLPASASVGLASGGLPAEGMLYGHSYTYLLGELLALKTAGFATPQLSGPQVALANNAPIWDRYMQGMISSLTPLQGVPAGEAYLGPTYGLACYGDVLRMFPTPEFGNMFAMLGLLDQQNGCTNRLNAERWYMIDALQGGSAQFYSRLSDPWSWGVQDTVMAFLFLDPADLAPTDPHASYPVTFYDAPAGRLVDRTDWGQTATMFDYRASWQSINHQQMDAGQFELYRKGEWLTKGVANYDVGENGASSFVHNTLALQNWCANGVPTDLQWNEGVFWTNGTSWPLGAAAGDPVTLTSFQPGYDFLHTDLTPLYNRPGSSPQNAAMDNTNVSRSILWIKPDYMVVYDRASSKHAGLFKQFNLNLIGPPEVTNNVITSTTPGGQNLTVTELLPVNSQLTVTPVGSLVNPIADMDPSQYQLALEDLSLPADTRFLHVFQGTDAGVTPASATLDQSMAGNLMDGAVFANTAVWFVHDTTAPFTGTAYTVPVSVTRHYVAGLTPGASYSVVSAATSAGLGVTILPAASGVTADSAGVLVF